MLGLSATTNSSVSNDASIMDIMSEFDKSTSEDRKINKATKKAHHTSRISALDKNISSLKDQQKHLDKAGKLGFIFGMISNVMNIAATVLSAIFPPLAPLITAINKFTQGLLDTISKKVIGGQNSKANKSATQSEVMKKTAESEAHYLSMDEEHLAALSESKRSTIDHLSQALALQQQAQAAAVRV